MRIVVAGDTYPPDVNGASVFTGRLATGLASRGHEVHQIAPSPSGRAYVEESDGVVVHRLVSTGYPWHPTFRIAHPLKARHVVPEIIRAAKPDVVHVQSHFVIARRAAAAARRQGVPWVATNHFMPENLVAQLPFGVPKLAFRVAADLAWRDLARVHRHAQVITTPTRTAAELLHRRAGIKGAIAISCGVDTSIFTPADGGDGATAAGRPILFVGRLEQEKHVNEIIDALPLVDPDITLRVVGEGSRREAWRRRAHHLGVAHRVAFLGQIDEAGLRAEYARSQVFCMPGTVELQSIATLEAMAAGLPIVAANALALPHLVHPGVNGDLYQPGDVEGLAAAIQSVLADEESRRALGQASRALVSGHDIELTLDAIEKTYSDAAEGSTTSR
jgi:glycosyltransferase involved in cell wall biosynthesis